MSGESHMLSFGNAEVVALLISRGADVNILNDAHATPLHDACARGDLL